MLPDPVVHCSANSNNDSGASNGQDGFSRDPRPRPSHKCPSADFSSHFVVKGSSSGSGERVCGDSSEDSAPNKCFSIPSVPPAEASGSGAAARIPTPSKSEVPLSPVKRNTQQHQHPFMKSPEKLSSGTGRMFENSPRSTLLAMPDSPMDSTYQPVSPYCLRKNRMGEYETEQQLESHPQTDYQRILKACGQREPIPIDLIFNGLKDIEKIGEGVYGEVYSGNFRYFSQYLWVYKVVAIAGDKIVNGEKQKSFAEVLPEILVSQELSKLKGVLNKCYTDGYAYMKNARIAKGMYPLSLLQPWEKFNQKYESDNDRPEFFEPEQLYMVLEFEHAGQDIESLNFRDARQTLSIVLQVAHILAVGECALEFEHRDLHWGNILVQTWIPNKLRYLLNGQTFFVPSAGIKVAVIDFTISRVKHSKSHSVTFLDLQDDEEQFLGTGDHQFDIYRMMRDHNRNDWQAYRPKSNVFWLHYLANKLYVKGQYSTCSNTSVSNARAHSKSNHHLLGHYQAVRKLREFSNTILEYDSATDFVRSEECLAYRQFLGLDEQEENTIQKEVESVSNIQKLIQMNNKQQQQQ